MAESGSGADTTGAWKALAGLILLIVIIVSVWGAYIYLPNMMGEEKSTKGGEGNVTVNHAPVAVISVDGTQATPGQKFTYKVGEDITFDANKSYDPDKDDSIQYLEWDFGTGAKSNNATVTINYTKPGTYTVVLTVRDSHMAENFTHVIIDVKPQDQYESYTMFVHNGIFLNTFDNTTQNFTVDQGFVNININITFTGGSGQDMGPGRARTTVYDPYMQEIGSNETTVLGQKTISYFFNAEDGYEPGDYMIKIECLAGTLAVQMSITVRY